MSTVAAGLAGAGAEFPPSSAAMTTGGSSAGPAAPTSDVSLPEIVKLAATDSTLYSHFFFPRTCRTKSPGFHRELWAGLEHPHHRYFAAMVFRDGAKTSLLRIYASKRIAYSVSRTILFVGKSEAHASRSVEWLMRQVETNQIWTETFGLRPGKKWTASEIEIYHGIDEQPIRVLAVGIHGSTRGINIEDYRHDLIIVDDPCDAENTGTPEQRQKMEEHFFGAIYHSLAPSEESPQAKLALLQTPLNREDLINTCVADPLWHGSVYGCFDEAGRSRWEARKPLEELRQEKQGYARRNQLSIWLREMECKIVSPETSAFRPAWLRTFSRLPAGGVSVLAIDPVPPPSEIQIQKGLRGKDSEVLAVVKRIGDDYFVCAYSANKGHEPDWTVSEFFEMALAWKPLRVVVEAVAYQRTLSWILKKAMSAQKQYYVIEEITDRRKKFDRIVDSLSGIASSGHLYVHESMADFIDQFGSYPDVPHDDILDAVAMAVRKLSDLGGLAHAQQDLISAHTASNARRSNWRAGIP